MATKIPAREGKQTRVACTCGAVEGPSPGGLIPLLWPVYGSNGVTGYVQGTRAYWCGTCGNLTVRWADFDQRLMTDTVYAPDGVRAAQPPVRADEPFTGGV